MGLECAYIEGFGLSKLHLKKFNNINSFSDSVSSIIIGNQAIKLYSEASAEREL